jgi:peptide/nickel transport system substrate-binding protein
MMGKVGMFALVRKVLAACVALAGLVAPAMVFADDLKIGIATEPSSLDPHFHVFSPNINVAMYTFDKLINFDENMDLEPNLALSWDALDDSTWQIKLREGVKFHDGTPLTAADVKFTIERAPTVPNSPSSYARFLQPIKAVEVVDDLTLKLSTDGPFPLLPRYLATFVIVSKKNGEAATTDDYNAGKAMIGTGPFKFVSWTKGDSIVFKRNEDYWGTKARWDTVTLKPIPQNASRVAALLAGDVDVIEQVPPSDVARIKADPERTVVQAVSNMVIYVHMDSDRDASPFVTDKNGAPLTKNPLKDPRVRKAMSMAINREAIVERVLEGAGVPAGQIQVEGTFAFSPDLKPEAYDPEKAKALLAEAGWGDGFGLTLHAPADRYVNDAQIAETLAQMLSRIGIATKVETMPAAVLFSRGTKLEFSVLMAGWNPNTGEPSEVLAGLLHTYNKEKGFGGANRGRYSNPAMDQDLEKALVTVDKKEHEALLIKATQEVRGDDGVLFLHHQMNTWGMRKGLTVSPRVDAYTLAATITSE